MDTSTATIYWAKLVLATGSQCHTTFGSGTSGQLANR